MYICDVYIRLLIFNIRNANDIMVELIRVNKSRLQSSLTKQRIIECAKELFIKKGYAATTIEDISEVTGCSKGKIYYHFQNKEAMFLSMLDLLENEWIEICERIKKQYPTPTAQLYGIAIHMMLDESDQHSLAFVAEQSINNYLSNEVQKRLVDMNKKRLVYSQQLLLEGMNSKEFAQGDSPSLAIILESFLSGMGDLRKYLNLTDTRELYKTSIDIFLFGISNKGKIS